MLEIESCGQETAVGVGRQSGAREIGNVQLQLELEGFLLRTNRMEPQDQQPVTAAGEILPGPTLEAICTYACEYVPIHSRLGW